MEREIVVSMSELVRESRPRAEIGGKAANLVALARSNLPVPRGFVLLSRARDAGEPAAAVAAAAALSAPLVVRSSAAGEDAAGAAAPGIYASVRDVEPTGVAAAVRAVWASADGDAARAYARMRGRADGGMAVLVQEQLAGVRGVVYTRLPGEPDGDRVRVECAPTARAAETTRAGDPVDVDPALPLAAGDLRALVALAVDAERAIGAGAGADVEWVWTGDRFVLVQARPIVHPPANARRRPLPPNALADAPAGVWRWDASHNPDPLSPAHASLVARVDAAGLAPARMQVIAGYLYVEETPPVDTPAPDANALWRRFDELAARMDAALAPVVGDPAPTLDAALAAHDEVYGIYARELGPLLSAARRANPEAAVPAHTGHGVGAWLDRAARGEIDRDQLVRQIGAMAPEWDLAAPTYAESPALVDRAVAVRRASASGDAAAVADRTVAARRASASGDAAAVADSAAAAAVAIGEEDDLYYARAQALVRRALLARARALDLSDPDDIFYVSVDDAARLPAGAIAKAARAARARRAVQATYRMPLVIRDGAPDDEPRAAGVFRGRGSGGRARGPAFLLEPGARTPVPAGAVAVARAVSPASAVLLGGAVALVCEHGGALGHAAALARELGIPCVVGARGVADGLSQGTLLLVDGGAGLVVCGN